MNVRLLKEGLIVSKCDKKLHLGIGERLDMNTMNSINTRHRSINECYNSKEGIHNYKKVPVTIVPNLAT